MIFISTRLFSQVLGIIEHQEKHWKKYFKDSCYKYYQYFINERNKLRFLSDYGLCEKLIKEIDKRQANGT